MGKRKKDNTFETQNRGKETDNADNKLIKVKAGSPPVLLPAKKSRKKVPKSKSVPYNFPAERSVHFDPKLDYSVFRVFQDLLSKWQCNRFITYPPFALEVCSLFIRAVNTTRISSGPEHSSNINSAHVAWSDAKSFFCGTIATLGWIYSSGYSNIVNRNSSIQSLGLLFFEDRKLFDLSMEIVQLLTAITNRSFGLTCSDICNVRIGEWMDTMLEKVKSGGIHKDKVCGGLYLPFYIILRAIHPDCSEVDQLPNSDLSPNDMAYIYLLEPNLYTGVVGEINLLPTTLNDGKNYNLWYFYDSLQPKPF